MEITLLRHGEPVIPPLTRITARSFQRWVELYNFADLSESSIPSDETIFHASKCNAVVCSELPRSIQSAKALKIENITLSSALFNEAGLPISNWQVIKLSPKTWAVIFRILWLLGYSRNSESYKEAKVRARKSVRILDELAVKYNSVLFVGHGVYNRLLSKYLIAEGWTWEKKTSSKHWEFNVYKK